MRILLIEDERRIADFVQDGLQAAGMAVHHCDNGHAGMQAALGEGVDLIVLDIMLPGRDGLSILQELRAKGRATPVILLTARNELSDRVHGLELGADDYLAKPFYVEELAARIHALLRRDRQATLQVGDIRLDRVLRQAHCQGQRIALTSREYTLLEYLMRTPGQVFTRSQILEHVWGFDFDPNTNVVDVCVKRIRAKMAELAPEASPIESVRGAGYRFRE
jgi:DNA-binding response OmpR family regulator